MTRVRTIAIEVVAPIALASAIGIGVSLMLTAAVLLLATGGSA